MIYIIWSILNIFIVIFFFYLLIGFIVIGKQIFKNLPKTISVLILLLGLIQIFLPTKISEQSNKIIITENYEYSNYTKLKTIKIENKLFFNINLNLKYSNYQNDFVPIEASSSLTGLVSGFEWKLVNVSFNKLKVNNQIEYRVFGNLKWTFFGMNIYNEIKTFRGKF